MRELRTQVAIIGAGPAGLLLGHILHEQGIDNIVLERRDRSYVEARVRAGVIEYGIAKFLEENGVGERMLRQGLKHDGVELRFDRTSYRIPLTEINGGKPITVYGQQEVVKDLIALRVGYAAPLMFETEVTNLDGLTTDAPFIEADTPDGKVRITCDYIAGCDGTFGPASKAIPANLKKQFDRIYPFSWLGIIAQAAPSTEELIYCRHERGFALYSMRSPTVSRLYLGVPNDEKLEDWTDDQIWDELDVRLATEEVPHITRGPILEKGITTMRSIVIEPMRYGRLFLAGDAAHIVPPTGAKGMNLAIGDVRELSRALIAKFKKNEDALLESYSDTCLERVWRAEEFSTYMTQMLHPNPTDDFENGVQLARLRQAVKSPGTTETLARNYVDLNSL
jgi:p-hydroxybenzoate 3-monooxygenase